MEHTPGPWKWKQNRGNNRYEHSVFTDHQIIAELDGETNKSNDYKLSKNIKANARLIASAPDLKAENDLLKEVNRKLSKYGYELAVLSLQSNRYQADPEYRDSVDNFLAILKSEGE